MTTYVATILTLLFTALIFYESAVWQKFTILKGGGHDHFHNAFFGTNP